MTQTILQTIRQAWKLDPKVSIADFAKENYRLPAGGPVSGRFDVEYTPYLKKILACLQLDNKEYEEIVFMKGAQVGATSAGLCLLNWIVGSGLSTNVLAVYPTERVCSRFVKKKFRPMIVKWGAKFFSFFPVCLTDFLCCTSFCIALLSSLLACASHTG